MEVLPTQEDNLNPIMAVEELEESGYDMIDGIPNNGFGEREKQEEEKAAEQHIQEQEENAEEQLRKEEEEHLLDERDSHITEEAAMASAAIMGNLNAAIDYSDFVPEIDKDTSQLLDESSGSDELIFKFSGEPISEELRGVLNLLNNGEYVSYDVINNLPEIKLANSMVHSIGEFTNDELFSRQPLRDKIYGDMKKIRSAVIDENGKTVYNGDVERGKRLDVIIGLPASGKSSTLVDPISSEYKSRLIDNDEAKKMFPEFNDGFGANSVHRESQMICRDLFRYCISRGENIVIPKVGSNAQDLIDSLIAPAKSLGYTVNVHYAELNRNKALGRMLERYCKSGRYLPPDLSDKYVPVINGVEHNKIAESYEALKDSRLVDGFSKWDNDVAIGERPILLENIGVEGKFIDNARTAEMEVNEHGYEQSGHEVYGINGAVGTGGGVRENNREVSEQVVASANLDGREQKQHSNGSVPNTSERARKDSRDDGNVPGGNSSNATISRADMEMDKKVLEAAYIPPKVDIHKNKDKTI